MDLGSGFGIFFHCLVSLVKACIEGKAMLIPMNVLVYLNRWEWSLALSDNSLATILLPKEQT
jgi:hypothetical protein